MRAKNYDRKVTVSCPKIGICYITHRPEKRHWNNPYDYIEYKEVVICQVLLK